MKMMMTVINPAKSSSPFVACLLLIVISSEHLDARAQSSSQASKWRKDSRRTSGAGANEPAAASVIRPKVGSPRRTTARTVEGDDSIIKQPKEININRRKQNSATTTTKSNNNILSSQLDDFKCPQFCTCSLIQVIDSSKPIESRVNLTRAKCEDPKFSDILTIDRRTQIIQISLPKRRNDPQENSSGGGGGGGGGDERPPTLDLDFGLGEMIIRPTHMTPPGAESVAKNEFRMPRLVQFALLREILISNLKFEICDSEVFKKGQKLRRIKWNHNQLRQISKQCLKHLDQLIDLNLDSNHLEELESAIFSNLIQLKYLSIANNKLTELAAHQFTNLTNLVSLNLLGNSFKTINLHLFEPMQSSLKQLNLAENQIKSFVHTIPQQAQPTRPSMGAITAAAAAAMTTTTTTTTTTTVATTNSIGLGSAMLAGFERVAKQLQQQLFAGVILKNLISLNVDKNKFERIKSLQLHRFFNVRFLSIRHNNITSIRDKAFNGLKLIQLNLASNNLQSISRCAFCNSTIKRLILSDNNITIVQQPLANALTAGLAATPPNGPQPSLQMLNQVATEGVDKMASTTNSLDQPASTCLLVMTQSLFGPLCSHLEYLDLSRNSHLADQLEFLIEPLVQLQYLKLASVGLDRSLADPNMFKNQRRLRYLNMASNQLDQLVSETVEPLVELEIFDLSHNKFNELDESLLVTLDEMASLRLLNLLGNPWYCSQCKIGPLYDWILRSPIYNSTCIAPSVLLAAAEQEQNSQMATRSGEEFGTSESSTSSLEGSSDDENDETQYHQILGRADDSQLQLFDETSRLMIEYDTYKLQVSTGSAADFEIGAGDQFNKTTERWPNSKWDRLAWRLMKVSASREGHDSLGETLSSLLAAERLVETQSTSRSPLVVMREHFASNDFCLKCEFPSELRAYSLHELNPGDFKYCAGSSPRFSASEPKIGLTLAIVIIGALFCIIIVVIFVYRKKSNTYYPNEDLTEQLEQQDNQTSRKQRPVLSVSSDVDHQFNAGDLTDYSSPPMSQSYESYSNESAQDEEEELDEDEEDEEGEDDEDEEMDEEEEEEEEEFDEEETDDYDDNERKSGDISAGPGPTKPKKRTPSTEREREREQTQTPGEGGGPLASLFSPPPVAGDHQQEWNKKLMDIRPTEASAADLGDKRTTISAAESKQPLDAGELLLSQKVQTANTSAEHGNQKEPKEHSRGEQKLAQLASLAGSLVHESNSIKSRGGGGGQQTKRHHQQQQVPAVQPLDAAQLERPDESPVGGAAQSREAPTPPSTQSVNSSSTSNRPVRHQQTYAHPQQRQDQALRAHLQSNAHRQSSEHSTASSQAALERIHHHHHHHHHHQQQQQQQQQLYEAPTGKQQEAKQEHLLSRGHHHGSQRSVQQPKAAKRQRLVQASQTFAGDHAGAAPFALAGGGAKNHPPQQCSLDSSTTPPHHSALELAAPSSLNGNTKHHRAPASTTHAAGIKYGITTPTTDRGSGPAPNNNGEQQRQQQERLTSIGQRPRLARQNNSSDEMALSAARPAVARAASNEPSSAGFRTPMKARQAHLGENSSQVLEGRPLHAHFSDSPSEFEDDEAQFLAGVLTDEENGAALEIQVEDEDGLGSFEADEEGKAPMSLRQRQTERSLHLSNSTHSALTQTGSNDFEH